MKQMKRKRFSIVGVWIIVSLSMTLLSAPLCYADKYRINLAASHTTGTIFQWVVPATSILNKNIPDIEITAIPTKGTTENMKYVGSKEAVIGAGGGSTAYQAYYGLGAWKGKPIKSLRVVYAMYADAWQIYLPKNSNVNSLSDLKGKRVNLQIPGSGGYTINHTHLKSLGIDPKKEYQPSYYSTTEAVQAMKEGRIDCHLFAGGPGSAAGLELANSRVGLKLISLTDNEIKKIRAAEPDQTEVIVEAGSYANVDYDIKTVGGMTALLAHVDVPEKVIYNIVKVLEENHDQLVKAISIAKSSSAKNTVKAYQNVIPFHPGAEKYFKEMGLIK
jgi:TRAP transporter TAXI family solute receptor